MCFSKVQTSPYSDQQAGTSGLRKKTVVFEANPYYLENYIQSCFNACSLDKSLPIIIGGDGRYYNDKAIAQTIRVAVANNFKQIIVAKNGILSTPACSHLIRRYKASLGLVFSASHNPGGKTGDVGIKLNLDNGGPAPLVVTEEIYRQSQQITYFLINNEISIDLSHEQEIVLGDCRIKVIDGVCDYADLLQNIFDFASIKKYLITNTLLFDAMHAVTGPYALEIFSHRLGVETGNILNATPLPDFGGGHPDPNPQTATFIYNRAMETDCSFSLLAASDGDGDRNMVVGKHIYVNPCDSLAVIVANAHLIPYFKEGVTGVARSMPTSRALDVVAASLNIDCYETPTGWKFFGNLLDSGLIQVCGEESFGTSANHIREKDGLWAVLCWLNILAATGLSAKALLEQHWKRYGRHYYARYDFENLDVTQAQKLLDSLVRKDSDDLLFGSEAVTQSGQFCYHDATDNSKTENQGYQLIWGDKARVVVRLSGTGTSGATLRLYLEVFSSKYQLSPEQVLPELAEVAIKFMQLKYFCNRESPDTII